MLDNLSTHKSLLSKPGSKPRCERLLPARYYPDFNPIEMAFAKLKAHVRQSAARTSEHLQTAVPFALSPSSLSIARPSFVNTIMGLFK